jgi:hypothetical protein
MLRKWNVLGKAHKKHEFGCKVSVVTSSRNKWVIDIDALHGNPYDVHTLTASIDPVERLVDRINALLSGYAFNLRKIMNILMPLPRRLKVAV